MLVVLRAIVWMWYVACVAALAEIEALDDVPFFASFRRWRPLPLYGLVGTLGAHVVEFFMNRTLFQQVGGSQIRHFLNTLIYGMIYILPTRRALAIKNRK